MGGFGSGKRYGAKDTTEGYRKLDVRLWQRKDLLTEGCAFTTTWSENGQETGCISVRIRAGQAILSYRHRGNQNGSWQGVRYAVGIEWTPCHFGGRRAWFLEWPSAFHGKYH